MEDILVTLDFDPAQTVGRVVRLCQTDKGIQGDIQLNDQGRRLLKAYLPRSSMETSMRVKEVNFNEVIIEAISSDVANSNLAKAVWDVYRVKADRSIIYPEWATVPKQAFMDGLELGMRIAKMSDLK